MYATPIKGSNTASSAAFLESHLSANSTGSVAGTTAAPAPAAGEPPKPHGPTQTAKRGVPPVQAAPTVMRQGTYMQREANFEIGRAAERKGITVREFDRGDRWLAWRKRALKTKKSMLARAARSNRKAKGKRANKAAQGGAGRRK